MWRQVTSIVFTVLVFSTQYAYSQPTCEPSAPDGCEFTGGVGCGWDLQGNLYYEQNGTDWYITIDGFPPSAGNLTSRKACSTNGSTHCFILRYLFQHNHIFRLNVFVKENGGFEEPLLTVSHNMHHGVWEESQMTIRTSRDFTVIIVIEKHFPSDLKLLIDSVMYTRSPCRADPFTVISSFSPSVSISSTTSDSVSDNEKSSSNSVVIAGIVVGIIVIAGVTVAVVVVVNRRRSPHLVGTCCRKDKQQDNIPVRASRVFSVNDAADNRQAHGENAEGQSFPQPVDRVYDSGYEIPISVSQLGTVGRNVDRTPGSAEARTSDNAAKALYENENKTGKPMKSDKPRYANQPASSKTTLNRTYENQAFTAEASKPNQRDIHTQHEEYEIPDTITAGTAHGTNGQNKEERQPEYSSTEAYAGLDFTKTEQERSVYTALYEGEARSEERSTGGENGQENDCWPSQRGNEEYAGLDFTNAEQEDNTYTGLQVAYKG